MLTTQEFRPRRTTGMIFHLGAIAILTAIAGWGLRSEEIPSSAVLWVRPAAELGDNLPLPWLRWPGAVIGLHQRAGDASVEFMASETQQLVLIATPKGIYAISPDDPAAFLSTYHRLNELGSFSPLKARSVYPTSLL